MRTEKKAKDSSYTDSALLCDIHDGNGRDIRATGEKENLSLTHTNAGVQEEEAGGE